MVQQNNGTIWDIVGGAIPGICVMRDLRVDAIG